MKTLSGCEKIMLKELQDKGKINWADINGPDTATLNRLVKKGYAEVFNLLHGYKSQYSTYWEPK